MASGHPDTKGKPVIRPSLINLLIVAAMTIINRFIFNVLAALTHDTPIGQALALVAA